MSRTETVESGSVEVEVDGKRYIGHYRVESGKVRMVEVEYEGRWKATQEGGPVEVTARRLLFALVKRQ